MGTAQRSNKPADPEEACRLWIPDRSRLGTELRDPLPWCANGGADSGGGVPGAPQTPYTRDRCTEEEAQSRIAGLFAQRGSYLALVAVDVANGVGHRVRAQQHARAAWPLSAHEVVLAHEDLAHVFCACHADQRPPQQVSFEHVAILLPPRRLEAGTLREPGKRPLSGRTSPDGMSRRPSLEGLRGRSGGSRPGQHSPAPPPQTRKKVLFFIACTRTGK